MQLSISYVIAEILLFCLTNSAYALSANINETLTLPEFSVEGGEGIDDGTNGCYAVIHLGGGSDGKA